MQSHSNPSDSNSYLNQIDVTVLELHNRFESAVSNDKELTDALDQYFKFKNQNESLRQDTNLSNMPSQSKKGKKSRKSGIFLMGC